MLDLTTEMIGNLAGDPSLYDEVPFLHPMRDHALSAYQKFQKAAGGCSSCTKRANERVRQAIVAAFSAIAVGEQKRDAGSSALLRKAVAARLKTSEGESFRVQYKQGDKDAELIF